MASSVTVKAAWIGAGAVVVAAVIAGVFSLRSGDSEDRKMVSQDMRGSAQSNQAGRDLNIYNFGTGSAILPPSSGARFPFDMQVMRAKDRIRYLARDYMHTNTISLKEVTGPYGDNVLDSPHLYDWEKVIEELEKQGYVKVLDKNRGNITFSYLGPSMSGRPAISVHFENKRPYADTIVLGNENWRGYIFRIEIQSESLDTLRIKHVKLVDLRRLEGNRFKPWEDAEPVSLGLEGAQSIELLPHDKIFIPFARIYPPELQKISDNHLSGDNQIPQLRFTVPPNGGWPRKMTSHIPPGTHRFRVQIFFEKGLPAEVELELKWVGNHRESVQVMGQEIDIKMIGTSTAPRTKSSKATALSLPFLSA